MPILPHTTQIYQMAAHFNDSQASPGGKPTPVPAAQDQQQQPVFSNPLSQDVGQVLVAVDFDNAPGIRLSRLCNIGVGLAILDPCTIGSVPADKAISTHHIVAGSPRHREKVTQKFVFGESVMVPHSQIMAHITSLIPRDKQVFLVGHGIDKHLRALDSLKFDYSEMNIIDTEQIARDLCHSKAPSLGRLLLELGCPYRQLHCAGNGANFTLRALLLMTVDIFAGQPDACHQKLADMEQIALYPVGEAAQGTSPGTKEAKTKPAMTGKHMSRIWDIETEERIRAERAEKKEALDAAGSWFFGPC